jgi:hypothetical protein
MTLGDMKKSALALIEEYDASNPLLTGDEDISAKLNSSVNRIMNELCRYKKMPKYVEMNVAEGDVIEFSDIESECGYEVFQIEKARGVQHTMKANGTVIKVLESGTLELDVFVYPERITDSTKDKVYEFEISSDLLEIMPYGIAADLLKNDISTSYGKVYSTRYEEMKRMIDPRYTLSQITVEGGYNI